MRKKLFTLLLCLCGLLSSQLAKATAASVTIDGLKYTVLTGYPGCKVQIADKTVMDCYREAL